MIHVETREHSRVPTKLYLQQQTADQSWPVGRRLPIPSPEETGDSGSAKSLLNTSKHISPPNTRPRPLQTQS